MEYLSMFSPISKKIRSCFMRPALNDELRVRHVLDAISEVESYLKGVSLEAFLSKQQFSEILLSLDSDQAGQ
jgi:hypothetical protein